MKLHPFLLPAFTILVFPLALGLAGEPRKGPLSGPLTREDSKGNTIHFGHRAGLAASGSKPRQWALSDPSQDGVEGTGTTRAYSSFRLVPPPAPIIVAVIDGGVDIEHEDLKDLIWTNEKELNGVPGKDNDGNGFVGDIHGWNFLGRADGTNLLVSSLEVTRELGRLKKKEAQSGLTPQEKELLARVLKDYNGRIYKVRQDHDKFQAKLDELEQALAILRAAGLKDETAEAVQAIDPSTPEIRKARKTALSYLNDGITTTKLRAELATINQELEVQFNPDFDPSSVIRDNPALLEEKGYGNPDVTTPTARHGTHVAGIIGALRDNGVGIQGQASYIRIMPVRAVPNGDERDKDVGNAIRYATDNGARIINMSFGKSYSPDRDFVDEAIRYATEHGVLLVHSAGNSSLNTDVEYSYPRKPEGAAALSWLEVGASDWQGNEHLPAKFSNYGSRTVDLFAPGVDILSTVPGNQYLGMSGTSMASPNAAGVAALVLSQYPQLTPAGLKSVLLRTVTRHPSLSVFQPGTDEFTSFAALSASGGIINAFNALGELHGSR